MSSWPFAVGFPIVVLLAWIFEFGGHHREDSGGRLGAANAGCCSRVQRGCRGSGVDLVLRFRGTARTPASAAVHRRAPFVNMSGDKENEYFSDGMRRRSSTRSRTSKALRVVARTLRFLLQGQERRRAQDSART